MLKKALVSGPNLFIVDDLPPEDLAMLQALYSRSADSVEMHMEKVHKAGSGKFMQNFYVGYNHKSIADCGSTTLFMEGVSTLAAKAVQDWPLYSGQETSTRYIDMSKQRIVDPVGTAESKSILDRWMLFYTKRQDLVSKLIMKRYPRRPEENEDVYKRAVKARCFDVLRAFLPAGITTQLSWHTNLRQAGDHLNLLSKHPSNEIRELGLELQTMFGAYYPSSGVGLGLAAVSAVTGGAKERAEWEQKVVDGYTYPSHSSLEESCMDANLRVDSLKEYEAVFSTRPKGCVLPHFMTDLGQISFTFPLDFGSFRDIQRHRNGVCRMPLLTADLGFDPWYLEQLEGDLAQSAQDLILEQTDAINALATDAVSKQYYVALGFRVPCHVTYSLPAALYVMELRSSKTVHPSLRRVVHWMIGRFRSELPQIPVYADMDPDDWTVRRGNQTILEK